MTSTSSTPLSTSTPLSISTPSTSLKSLPMKFKAMHYGILAFLSSQELTGSIISPEQVSELIKKIPIFEDPDHQVLFYNKVVDFKHVQNNILKPMIKKRNTDLKNESKPVKEKKPRKKAEPKSAKKSSTSTTATTEVGMEVSAIITAPVAENVTTLTNEMAEEPFIEPMKLVLSPEPVIAAVVEKVKKTATKRKAKEETTPGDNKKKKVVKKGKEEVPAAAPVVQQVIVQPSEAEAEAEVEEMYLLIRNNIKYWTADEYEQTGPVFEYIKDIEGDGAPGKCVGNLVLGELRLF